MPAAAVCSTCVKITPSKYSPAPFGHEGLEAKVAADLSIRVFVKLGDPSASSPDRCSRAHDLVILILTTAMVIRRGVVVSK